MKKNCINSFLIILCLFIIFTPKSYGTNDSSKYIHHYDFKYIESSYVTEELVVSKSVAVLLMCMQILEYVVPSLYFILKLFIKKKHNLKEILLNIIISFILFLAFIGLGNLIISSANDSRYLSKTIDYIKYNGEIIYYYHK